MSGLVGGVERAGRLDRGGVIRMVTIGVIGWAMAALFIRMASKAGLFHGAGEIAMFGLCFPVAWAGAWAMRRRGVLTPEQMVPGMAIGLIAALFLDGVALTGAPWIYGAAPGTLLQAAAWLLFGVGAFLSAAFLEAR